MDVRTGGLFSRLCMLLGLVLAVQVVLHFVVLFVGARFAMVFIALKALGNGAQLRRAASRTWWELVVVDFTVCCTNDVTSYYSRLEQQH